MWTDDQLDAALYVVFRDQDSGQTLNVGTIEIQNSIYQGPYVCVPMPPFGSLKGGDGLAGLGQAVHIHPKRITHQRNTSRGFPNEAYGDKMVLHQFGTGMA